MSKVVCSSIFMCALLTAGVPATALPFEYRLVETGSVQHNTFGQGIDMRITATALPQESAPRDVLAEAIFELCNHYAPVVVRDVLDRFDIAEAEFIRVLIVSDEGGSRTQLRRIFALDGDSCGTAMN